MRCWGKLVRKIKIAHYEFLEAPFISSYNHHGNRLATILGLNKKDGRNIAEIAHELAMQVAAMNPIAVDKENVSQEIINHEVEIGKEQARQEGKPEEMLDKDCNWKAWKILQRQYTAEPGFCERY